MDTLSSNSISKKLKGFESFTDAIKVISDNNSVFPCNVTGLQGSLESFFLKEYLNAQTSSYLQSFKYAASGYSSSAINKVDSSVMDSLVVVPTERDADKLCTDLKTVFNDCEVYVLRPWGTSPYRSVNINASVFSERAGVLSRMLYKGSLIKKTPRIFIVPQYVVQSPLPPPEFISSFSFSLHTGDSLDTVAIASRLTSLGFTRTSRVGVKGEFSLRGEVLDIYLSASENPFRITFDFDTIERIKTFDVESQSTLETVDSVLIYPMKEVIWNEALISKLKDLFDNKDNKPYLNFSPKQEERKSLMLEELSSRGFTEGEELFYPLLWDKQYSVFDYIGKDSRVFLFYYDRLCNAQDIMDKELMGLYKKEKEVPVFPPNFMYFTFQELLPKIPYQVRIRSLVTADEAKSEEGFLEISSDQSHSYFNNINLLKEELTGLLNEDWSVYIFCNNDTQALRIEEILKDFTNLPNPLHVTGLCLSEGFVVNDIKLKVIQENEIFGRKNFIARSGSKVKSSVIDTFVELNPGDYVVHVNYGIGLFKGIDRVRAMGNERDYIKLEYQNEEFVFVPIEQVNMIQRYIGNEGDAPRLDRLGSKAWENRKNKVRKAVEDLAQKLIELYSRRQASQGFAFPKETEFQTEFEASFPYEDTPDQATVTKEIYADMEKALPMDRLVCGDVGYGKTEISMRAAFKAVVGGRQVAFLAPTTILAEQHYETCLERFKGFSVNVAHMSRFVSPKEQRKILEDLKEGRIDILVGTHRIIQKDVEYKNLGLMIIDEEQRFGVKDKEKLKTLKNNIDSLALSATPIPRTLHMSLLKIRDMSLLTTPPVTRKPIETIVDAFSDDRVSKAIRSEVDRGGQVFYLHNRVETLLETRFKLEKLVPEMTIEVAHGQMSSQELDDIFRRFKMGAFHVLVATTIIENGIDIPNVNTIIIDRADMYGISQLYQLRGRVGRSDRKAYAYLLYPGNKSLSEIAMKRLQVISDFTELGSGFKIAMKDMEIRGAGNLLGRDQSGNVYSVGFDMYVRLLNDAVNRLMNDKDYKGESEVLLELEYTGFIPETYILNPQTKMEIYKKIASISREGELEALYVELSDRYGPVPEEVLSLLSLSQIRVLCKKLNVLSIKERKGIAYVEFGRVSDINVNKVVRLIGQSGGSVRLDATRPNMILLNTGKIGLKEKGDFIREKLEQIV